DDGAGKLVLLEPPASLVHLVNALVAQVAVAEVPLPVPVVVEALAQDGLHRGRATPEVVVHSLRRRLRAVDLADAAARLVAQATGHLDFAELAGLDEGDGLAHAGHAAALGAGLADLVELAGGFNDAPALTDVVADRLLDVDVLASLHGPDGGQRVPV